MIEDYGMLHFARGVLDRAISLRARRNSALPATDLFIGRHTYGHLVDLGLRTSRSTMSSWTLRVRAGPPPSSKPGGRIRGVVSSTRDSPRGGEAYFEDDRQHP
jgi:hypothetical protein